MFPSSSAVAGTYGRSGQVSPVNPPPSSLYEESSDATFPPNNLGLDHAAGDELGVRRDRPAPRRSQARFAHHHATQAKPGYLNEGEPFALRKAPQLRPPAYALPALPIAPDPQPLPLAASTPAQPLNPAQGGGRPPAPGITIPAMRVAPIQPFTIEARPTFVAPGQMIQSGAPAGMSVSGLGQPHRKMPF